MRRRLMQASVLVVCLISAGACAGSTGSSTAQGVPGDEIIPARLKSTSGPAVMDMPSYHGWVDVPIDATGRPLTAEARFSRNASTEVRREITAWIERLSFDPATRNGVPIRGSFTLHFK